MKVLWEVSSVQSMAFFIHHRPCLARDEMTRVQQRTDTLRGKSKRKKLIEKKMNGEMIENDLVLGDGRDYVLRSAKMSIAIQGRKNGINKRNAISSVHAIAGYVYVILHQSS